MRIVLIIFSLFTFTYLKAQELYPSSEPASNMSAKSIGLRLNNKFFPAYTYQNNNVRMHNNISFRLNPEVMWGINKKWMFHINLFASNIHQINFKFEGGGIYLKYRFLSIDKVQSHFRMAVYGKASLIDNAIQYNEINLAGDNSGVATGIVVTQLIHKIALSATGGYIRGMNNLHDEYPNSQSNDMLDYTISLGYLFLPFHYHDYSQPNLNLYIECLGKVNPNTKDYYTDIAPAVQLIINSVMRVDFIYERQLSGNMFRQNMNEFVFRFEYNFFNVYKGKS